MAREEEEWKMRMSEWLGARWYVSEKRVNGYMIELIDGRPLFMVDDVAFARHIVVLHNEEFARRNRSVFSATQAQDIVERSSDASPTTSSFWQTWLHPERVRNEALCRALDMAKGFEEAAVTVARARIYEDFLLGRGDAKPESGRVVPLQVHSNAAVQKPCDTGEDDGA